MIKNLDKELQKTDALSKHSWGKAISKLKKHFDTWVAEQLYMHDIRDFKLAYMPLIMNIDVDGITNTDLAKRAGITKQGMSQVVQELEEKKYIKIQTNPKDKRSSIIHLTDKGKEFILTCRGRQKDLHADLQKLLGKKKFEIVLDAMFEVVNYQEEVNQKKPTKKH
ncbi:MAG TPA: MarR family transcriptional regulator [Bacteroidia bacterium]|jgi:DNA-binding MarR family transcriptional regulator|nr:MarR family transcriptional regulator [Bacteroidia bacterium]